MARRINLVPPSERARTTTDVGLLLMLVAFIVVIFGLGFGYYLLSNQLNDKEAELVELQQQVAQIEAQVAALRQYEVIKARKDDVEEVVSGIYAARTDVSGVLNDVSLVVPDTVWFQSLSLTTADPVLPGGTDATVPTSGIDSKISIDATTYSFEEVAQVLTRLKLVPSLSNVELLSATGREIEGAEREIKTLSLTGSVLDTSTDDELPLTQIQVEIP